MFHKNMKDIWSIMWHWRLEDAENTAFDCRNKWLFKDIQTETDSLNNISQYHCFFCIFVSYKHSIGEHNKRINP